MLGTGEYEEALGQAEVATAGGAPAPGGERLPVLSRGCR